MQRAMTDGLFGGGFGGPRCAGRPCRISAFPCPGGLYGDKKSRKTHHGARGEHRERSREKLTKYFPNESSALCDLCVLRGEAPDLWQLLRRPPAVTGGRRPGWCRAERLLLHRGAAERSVTPAVPRRPHGVRPGSNARRW